MAKQDAIIIEEFTKIVSSHLKDVLIALPAIIPQNKEDEKLFKDGREAIADLIYHLDHAENIRELSRYIDVQKVASDFDEDSIKLLNSRINNSARSSVMKLDEMLENMREGESDEY